MLTVAVTGGIGSGKSTVSAALALLGATVVDSDRLAREVVAPGTSGLAEVVRGFGTSVLARDGALDRAALARIVFADSAARRRLEAITHPLVRAAFRRARDAAEPGAIVVNDIPLVRTVAEAAAFHLVVTVSAADEIRVRRLIARGLTGPDARARMQAQVSDVDRRAFSDIWIDNDGDEVHLRRRVEQLWRDRLVPMRDNIAARRPAPRQTPEAVDHDPSWSAQARLLGARISAAANGLPCEHVGATAVLSRRAADVIDLRLRAPDAASADRIATGLAEAGFPRVPPRPTDAADDPGTAGPSANGRVGARQRLHANADPGRAVDLHVVVGAEPG